MEVREEGEQEIKNVCEKIMKENFPNVVKAIGTQVQEAQRLPKKMNPKRPIQGTYIITKMTKFEDKK